LEDSLVTALIITAIGMTLLFLSLALFYGLLSLMTALLRERSAEADGARAREGEQAAGPGAGKGARLRAAALAVALARAEAEQGTGLVPGDEVRGEAVSSWWALHHQRRLAFAPKARRTR
jgi:Na+-transporting methylmalonyl-CoA/oxaloacetate decarboxylase gamma subunit